MRQWMTLCICILVFLAMPLGVTAAVVGDENATMTPVGQTGQPVNLTENVTIVEYINQDRNLTTLAEAIDTAGLSDTLNTTGPYTVFAPSNEAFIALGNDTVTQLMNEPGNLTILLQYHVIEGEYTAANLTNMSQNQIGGQSDGGVIEIISGLLGGEEAGNMTTLNTLSGETLNVTTSDGEVMVENATITIMDINTTNGVIHIIDRVLVPPALNLTAAENQTMTPIPTETMTESQPLVGVVQ